MKANKPQETSPRRSQKSKNNMVNLVRKADPERDEAKKPGRKEIKPNIFAAKGNLRFECQHVHEPDSQGSEMMLFNGYVMNLCMQAGFTKTFMESTPPGAMLSGRMRDH